MPGDTIDSYIKTKLVPSGAYNRFHMISVTVEDWSPSFVCEAVRECA